MQYGGVVNYLLKVKTLWLLDGRYPCFAKASICVLRQAFDMTICCCITRAFDSVNLMWAFAKAFLQAFTPHEATGLCSTCDEITVDNMVVPSTPLPQPECSQDAETFHMQPGGPTQHDRSVKFAGG